MATNQAIKVGVEQKICPIRIMMVIQPDNSDRFLRAMQLGRMFWGGIYSPIIPYYLQIPHDYRVEYNMDLPELEFYQNTVANYDPDIILYDEDIGEASIAAFSGERELMAIDDFLQQIIDGDINNGISVVEIVEFIAQSEFKFLRSDKVKFSLPHLTEQDFLLNAFIGSLPDPVKHALEDVFQGNEAFEQPELNWPGMQAYQSYPKVDLTDVINYKLHLWSERPNRRSTLIYLMRSDRINDVINYWNLRAAGCSVVPVPVNVPDLTYFTGFVGRMVEAKVKNATSNHVMIMVLLGHGLTKETIDEVTKVVFPAKTEEKPEVLFAYQQWFPRFWSGYYIQESDHIKSSFPFFDSFYDHYDPEEGRLKFKPKSIPFETRDNLSRESAYKVLFNLSLHDEYAEYAELLTGITTTQMKQLTEPFDFRNWRLSPSGMHRLFNRSDRDIHISLPGAVPFFKMYFANKAHRLNETANSKLAKEVLKNIGGLHQAGIFLRVGSLKVIELFEGGKVVSFDQLVGEIKKNGIVKHNNGTKNFIDRLLEHKMIEMGAHIQCSVCEQHGFYLPGHIASQLTCPICRNTFYLPMSEPSQIVWSYRGIGPFSRTNKADGVLAVFAALKLFHQEFTGVQSKISSLIGFELIKTGQAVKVPKEVDLGIVLENQYDPHKDPDLLFCECKTYKRFTEKDMDRMKILGDEFPGAILALATLNEQLNEDEQKAVADLVKYFQRGNGQRPRNPVLILTGKELLSESFRGAFQVYKTEIRPYNRYNDFIGALCELTITKQLQIPNWWDIKNARWDEYIQKKLGVGRIIGALLNHEAKPQATE